MLGSLGKYQINPAWSGAGYGAEYYYNGDILRRIAADGSDNRRQHRAP